jgi:glycosyltransferase involved in cell wall biosynthesis
LKVSGFTFVRNAVKFDYPVVESIHSILPLCDEVIVSIGQSEDNTEELIRSIASDKIKIFPSVWDDSLKQGGKVLAVETNKALDRVSKTADWCFYLQADEIIHERYHEPIREAMTSFREDPRVEGLLFKYLHFYGSYDYVGDSRTWYSHEIRVIRNDSRIRSYRDAQGFRKDGRKLQVMPVNAYVYHYGWVRHPQTQFQKHLLFEKLYQKNTHSEMQARESASMIDYSAIDSLERFTGTHPLVMQPRIRKINWQFDHDISRKNFSFKDKLLYWIEKKTGKRLFEYQNYKIID